MVACVLGYLLDLGSPRREFYSTCIKLGPQRHRKLGGGRKRKRNQRQNTQNKSNSVVTLKVDSTLASVEKTKIVIVDFLKTYLLSISKCMFLPPTAHRPHSPFFSPPSRYRRPASSQTLCLWLTVQFSQGETPQEKGDIYLWGFVLFCFPPAAPRNQHPSGSQPCPPFARRTQCTEGLNTPSVASPNEPHSSKLLLCGALLTPL